MESNEQPEIPPGLEGIPIHNTFGELGEAIWQSDNYLLSDRNRPYDGQPHTDQGERGKTLVEGLTMRDVADCFALGFMQAAWHVAPEVYQLSEVGQATQNDLYRIPDLNKLDPGAVIKNAMCQIEMRMGIYPNIPKEMRTPEHGGPPIE